MFHSTYGGTNSLSSRADVRMTNGFESYPAACSRTALNETKIAKGLKRARNHVGNLDSYTCDFDGCVEEV